MANKKTNVKDLKSIGGFGKVELSKWGIIGAAVIFIYSIVSMLIIRLVFDVTGFGTGSDIIVMFLRIGGLVLGILYLILGIFGIVAVTKSQEGDIWWVFLIGSIAAVLAPLTWFGMAGIILAIIAFISFLIFYITEKK